MYNKLLVLLEQHHGDKGLLFVVTFPSFLVLLLRLLIPTAHTETIPTAGRMLLSTYGRIKMPSMYSINGKVTQSQRGQSIFVPPPGRKTMGETTMWLSRALVAALLLIPIAAHGGEVSEVKPELSRTVTGFYRWVVAHGNETARLEPHVVQLAGSTRLVVDLSTLDAYTSAFMQSGYFAPEFPSHVAAFYRRSAKSLEKYSKSDFDEMAREGRGPLIDSEDIDVFFCSQEGEYTNRYADGLRVAKAEAKDDTADAEIVTPDGWKTNFKFHKIGTRWLISGYCLYQ